MKWLKNRVGQGCILHVINPAHYKSQRKFYYAKLCEVKLWHSKTKMKV